MVQSVTHVKVHSCNSWSLGSAKPAGLAEEVAASERV